MSRSTRLSARVARLAIATMSVLTTAAFAQGQACTGSFPNLITDVCWDCVFPVSMGGGLINMGITSDDYDTGVGHAPICICTNNLSIGTPVGFWEPRYMVGHDQRAWLLAPSRRYQHQHRLTTLTKSAPTRPPTRTSVARIAPRSCMSTST